MADAEYDYAFNAAKALGATQITMELPADPAVSKRIGDAAAKHDVNVGYHLHTTASMTAWDAAMAQSPRNGIQLDVGHYVAGTGLSPVPLHREAPRPHLQHAPEGSQEGVPRRWHENMPWGQGDTPHQGRAADAEEEQVGHPGRGRVRVPGASRARPGTPRSPSASNMRRMHSRNQGLARNNNVDSGVEAPGGPGARISSRDPVHRRAPAPAVAYRPRRESSCSGAPL